MFDTITVLKPEEWEFFKEHLVLSDARIEQLKQLPAGVDPKLNLPSPEYILKHPEHYDTFGKWLKAMRAASGLELEDIAEKLGKMMQAIAQIESKGAESGFTKRQGGQIPIPEQYLNEDPYGIFPKDKQFRSRFLALSEPNVMKRQYEEAQNWITHPQMMKELGLEWDYTLHREVLHYWRQDTIGVENGKRGTIAIRGGYIDVMRDTEGDLRFHKSSVDKLKADPEIQAHIARQKEHGVER